MEIARNPNRGPSGSTSDPPLRSTLWHAPRAHWRNALYWFLCAILGGLLPLWVTLFIRAIYERSLNLEGFVLHGDPVLYAAAFLGPVIYHVGARMRKDTSILGMGALITAVIALLLSAIVYVVVNPEIASSGTLQQAHGHSFLNLTTWSLLLLSSCLSLCVFMNEQQLEFEEFDQAEKAGQQTLRKKIQERNPPSANATPIVPAPGSEEPVSEEELMGKFTEERHG